MGSLSLLQGIFPTQESNRCLLHCRQILSCPTLCDPMDSSPPGSPIHGIFHGRVLEWVAIAFSNFPGDSDDKESTCNAGDTGLIPGLGRCAREGIGHPLQSSWASYVAQLVKNPPAMQETWVLSLDWEDPLEKGKATHSRILAWRITWTV